MLCTLVQASEDAKSIIEKERQEAQVEIEAARATALRCQQALEEQAHTLSQVDHEVENQKIASQYLDLPEALLEVGSQSTEMDL